MALLGYEGFDVSATGSHYTSGKGWHGSSDIAACSAAASRNAAGMGMEMVSSNDRMIWIVQSGEEDDTFICGVAYKPTLFHTTAGHMNAIMSFLGDDAATVHVTIGHDLNGRIHAKRGNQGGTTLGSESGTTFATLNSYHYVEAKVVLHDTNGSVEVRIDGSATPVLSLTGIDTKNGGTDAVFDSVCLRANTTTAQAGAGHFDDFYLCNDQGVINNTFLGDVVVQTLFPTGNGTTSQLVGSDGNSTDNYLLVDEVTPNTSDYNGSGTDNNKDTYAMGNLSGTPTSIRAVKLNAYAAKDAPGTRDFAFVVRSGGVENDSADVALSTTYQYYNQTYLTDPTDGATWTQSKVDGMEAGFKVRP